MDRSAISVTRTLPIDGVLLSDVLLRLRRDAAHAVVRWTLGDRGAAEVDVHFASEGREWVTTGRIWNDGGLTNVTFHAAPIGDDAVELRLDYAIVGEARAGLAGLADAVVDELAEELLWHGAHSGIARQY
jgi:hypothetical protein